MALCRLFSYPESDPPEPYEVTVALIIELKTNVKTQGAQNLCKFIGFRRVIVAVIIVPKTHVEKYGALSHRAQNLRSSVGPKLHRLIYRGVRNRRTT